MRYLGIDYGKKRVGTAVSDTSGSLAFPREVLRNDNTLIPKISELVANEGIDTIVVGHSLSMGGEANPIQESIDTFVIELKKQVSCDVFLEPEWYTTQEVYRTQGKTEHKDASSAAIILNQFLDRKK